MTRRRGYWPPGLFVWRAAGVYGVMPTEEQLTAIMPALPAVRRQAFLPFLQQAIDEFEIAAPARQAAFLAQLAHESGQLRFMEEIWGPTPSQLRYEPVTTLSAKLGNTEAGDGKRFKGRGPIQLTGRSNYTRFGAELGVDLIADPARAAAPEVAFRIAGLFWRRNGLNELADRSTPEAFVLITKRINGGTHGLADRERFHAAARKVLGVGDVVAVPAGAAARSGPVMAARPEADELLRGAEAIRLAARAPKRRAAAKTAAKKRPAASRTSKRAGKKTKKAAPRKAAPKKAALRKVVRKRIPEGMAGKRTAATPGRRLAKKR
jgi:putative chitinase